MDKKGSMCLVIPPFLNAIEIFLFALIFWILIALLFSLLRFHRLPKNLEDEHILNVWFPAKAAH